MLPLHGIKQIYRYQNMTKTNKPLILVTNDDGVNALGIKKLTDALRPLGEIVVIAPSGPRSGMSSAITSEVPLRVNLIGKEEGVTYYSCTGTPVDCVKLGVNEILPQKPDLVVSGINHGSNAGICVIYSGTIGAALEGCVFGIPSIGVSLTDHSPQADFSQSAHYAQLIARKVLEEGLPQGVCLNVNVPNIDNVKGIKVCTQTKGHWIKEFKQLQDPNNKTVYWLTGEFLNAEPHNTETDEWALANGYAAIVPLRIDMTAHQLVDQIKHWEAEEIKV